MNKKVLFFLIILIFSACNKRTKQLINSGREFHIPTVNNNVCKRLVGNVVLYAVFVDSEPTSPWTTFDITSTIDSILKAISWMEAQATQANVRLNMSLEYHQNSKGVIPIEGRFSRKTLSETISATNGIKQVDTWADQIARTALGSFGPDTSVVTNTKVKPRDRERLIARLRDIHKTDNVALIYFINNYYKEEMSVALHTASRENPEYAIVSYKNPGVIIHEFLHLFGALDLYVTPFDTKKNSIEKKAFAMNEFPDEIMAFPRRGLDSLNIGRFTKYLIGWERELDNRYKEMFIEKKINVIKY